MHQFWEVLRVRNPPQPPDTGKYVNKLIMLMPLSSQCSAIKHHVLDKCQRLTNIVLHPDRLLSCYGKEHSCTDKVCVYRSMGH